MVRLGQNFLADPNLLDAIVRDAELAPDDVVLEVGAGEGALTERLAARRRPRPRDRDRPRAGAGAGADRGARPNVELHWGDAMKLDLAGLEPAPTAVVSNLPYSIATPLILRTIEELPAVRRWTVMVQREIADRLRAAAGQPHLRLAQRARAARLRGEAAAHRRPRRSSGRGRGSSRRSSACAAPGPAPTRPPASWSAPPSPTAASRWPARWSTTGPDRWAAARAALRELGLPEDARAEDARPRGVRRPGARDCAASELTPLTPDAHPAPAKLNLCLFLGPRREDGLHELCSLFEPLALADAIEVSEAGTSATRSSAPGSRARTSPRGRWRRCASAAGTRRRCGSRSRSGSRSPPGSAAAAPTPPRCCALRAGTCRSCTHMAGNSRQVPDLEAIAAELGADVPSQLGSGACAGRGAGERVERLPGPGAARGRPAARRRRAEHRGGLRRGRPARARPRRGGAGRAGGTPARGGRRAAPRRSTTPSCSPTTSSRRRARCGREIGAALDALRECRRPARLHDRLGAHRRRPLPHPGARRKSAAARDSTATTRSSARPARVREAGRQ